MKIYQVGGAVRDRLLGRTPQDTDYVVVGADAAALKRLGYRQVGAAFPVFLHPETREEYALARREFKQGPRHGDFSFVFDATVSLKEDLARRDFTCNALAFDMETQTLIDPFGGGEDIRDKVLRPVSAAHFAEDPLRVLRLCRFAAQLDFKASPEAMKLARGVVKDGLLAHLSPERIWGEIAKALAWPRFDKFILTARRCGALAVVMSAVDALFSVPEKLIYHPEGNTGSHTVLALRKARAASARVKFAILVHDLGKTRTPPEILPSHRCHEERGLPLIRELCQALRVPADFRDFALLAARHHMQFWRIPTMKWEKLAELADILTRKRSHNLEDFIAVCAADLAGRAGKISVRARKQFELSAQCLRAIAAAQKRIKAADMPAFSELPHDASFEKHYRRYRLARLKEAVALADFRLPPQES